MLTDDQVSTFAARGFVLGSHVLGDEELDVLRAELRRVIDDHDHLERRPVRLVNLGGDEAAPVWQIVNIWQASDAFEALVHHPVIAQEVAQLTGASELRLWHDQIQYKPAAIGGVNMWHQDSPYWPNIAPKEAQVTAWVALDDVDAENGCMSMVPGTHLWGNRIDWLHTLPTFDAMPQSVDGQPTPAVLCPVSAGQVHYHHGLTWHGSQANRSGRPRRAIALHFMTQDTVYRAAGDHPMKPFVTVADGQKLAGAAFPQVWPRS
jgi:ectoine hydroxylase-related dioxygenase (phytanoyl-CoA dioxygenase family)